MQHFRNRGWKVDYTDSGDRLNFFILDAQMRRCAVGIVDKEPSHLEFIDMAAEGHRSGSFPVYICATPCSKAAREAARDRGILLLPWDEVSQFESSLARVREHYDSALLNAKLSPETDIPPEGRDLSQPLYNAQHKSGFFFQTENISCHFTDRGGEDLLFTFAPWKSDPELPTRWGEIYGLKEGFSVLGFETNAPNWYPANDMAACISAAQRLLGGRFRNRYGVGAVQGAFAAIRYSRLLGIKATLAFSPQYTIDPVLFRDYRYSEYYRAALHSGMRITSKDTSGMIVLVIDPYETADSDQAAMISKEVNVKTIMLPFAGHGINHVHGDPATLVGLLAAMKAQNIGALQVRAVTARRLQLHRPLTMALALAYRRPQTALAIFERYRDTNLSFDWFPVCFRLAESGMGKEVLGWMKTAASVPPNAEQQACLALVALKVEDRITAMAAITIAREIDPKNPKYINIYQRLTE
jgi:hypothetical protein